MNVDMRSFSYCICLYIHIYTHTRTYTHIHTHVHKRTRTHTHTSTRGARYNMLQRHVGVVLLHPHAHGAGIQRNVPRRLLHYLLLYHHTNMITLHHCENVMTPIISGSCPMFCSNVSRSALKCVKKDLWMSHVTRVDESCHTYARGMSHVCKSRTILTRVYKKLWMCHVSRVKGHATGMKESCHAYE